MLGEIYNAYGPFNEEFEKAVEDGIITQEESDKLHLMRNEIYKRAYMQAVKDGVITEDEEALLKLVQRSESMSDEEVKRIRDQLDKGLV